MRQLLIVDSQRVPLPLRRPLRIAILRSAASHNLLKTYDPTSPPEDRKGAEKLAKKMLDNLNVEVLPHLTSNISKAAITSMRDTCARLTEKCHF
jgi:hypothetical protein